MQGGASSKMGVKEIIKKKTYWAGKRPKTRGPTRLDLGH